MNKGQVSIEFITLLSVTLVGSSILIGLMNERAIAFRQTEEVAQTESIAQKTAYKIDYLISSQNSTVNLDYPASQGSNTTIQIQEGIVSVENPEGSANYPTSYQGQMIQLKTDQSYSLNYNEGEITLG